MSEFTTTPLPRDRPLWEALVIDGLDAGGVAFARITSALPDASPR
jgi:hypothetical protein